MKVERSFSASDAAQTNASDRTHTQLWRLYMREVCARATGDTPPSRREPKNPQWQLITAAANQSAAVSGQAPPPADDDNSYGSRSLEIDEQIPKRAIDL